MRMLTVLEGRNGFNCKLFRRDVRKKQAKRADNRKLPRRQTHSQLLGVHIPAVWFLHLRGEGKQDLVLEAHTQAVVGISGGIFSVQHPFQSSTFARDIALTARTAPVEQKSSGTCRLGLMEAGP